jgi:putative glutamine amidotransferase
MLDGDWSSDVCSSDLLVAPGDPLPAFDSLSGLMLCGGLDIHPRLWDGGEPVHPAAEVDEARDAFEAPLVREAWRLGLPILGICRGEQMLNAALGGSLIQDIPSHFGCESERHRHGSADIPDLHHAVRLDPLSRLTALLGCPEIQVNSRHHQAVKRLAPGLKAAAWHPETRHPESGALIEGIEAEDPARWAFGIQWHPENLVGLEDEAGAAARRLFEGFAEAARG